MILDVLHTLVLDSPSEKAFGVVPVATRGRQSLRDRTSRGHGPAREQSLTARNCDPLDTCSGDEVLRVPFFDNLAGIHEEQLVFAVLRFAPVQEEQDARGACVVEQIFRQVDNSLNEILLDEPLTDGPFLVLVGVTAATGGGAGVQNDRCPASVVQRGENVLRPAQIGRLCAWEAGPLWGSGPVRRHRSPFP